MDDHQPSWEGNGSRFLGHFGLDSTKTKRLNVFLTRSLEARGDAPPAPIDSISFAKGLVENFSLEEAELHRLGISPDGATALAQALSCNKYLKHLGLSRNRCGNKGGIMLADAMKVNQTLTTLDVSWNDFNDEVIANVAEALIVNNSLQHLVFDRNRVSSDGAGAIATALAANHKLRYLSLSNNDIGAAGFSFLGRCAAQSTALTTLDLSMNGTAMPGIFSLLYSVRSAGKQSALQSLNLSFNTVGDAIALVGEVIAVCPTLRELSLENTRLAADKYWRAFISKLAKNGTLLSLSVAKNDGLGNAGINELAQAIISAASAETSENKVKHTSVLRYLDLSETGLVGPDSLAKLGKLVSVLNGTLSTLHLSDNKLGQSSGSHIAELLGGSNLSFFGMANVGLGLAGTEALLSKLRYSSLKLRGLNVRDNQIGNSGFAQWLPIVLHHGVFEYIDFSNNGITDEKLVSRLNDVFEANPQLPYVVIEDNTVIHRGNQYASWEELNGHSPAHPSLPLPPLTNTSVDLNLSTLQPSWGMATYSLAIGSCLKRQKEGATPHDKLFPMAGKPVKHCRVWEGKEYAPTAPDLASGRFTHQINSAITSRMEINLQGLPVTDDQLRREFNKLDLNGNGFLEKEEFKNVYATLEQFGVELTELDLEHIATQYGGGDNKITFDQFCVIILGLVRH